MGRGKKKKIRERDNFAFVLFAGEKKKKKNNKPVV